MLDALLGVGGLGGAVEMEGRGDVNDFRIGTGDGTRAGDGIGAGEGERAGDGERAGVGGGVGIGVGTCVRFSSVVCVTASFVLTAVELSSNALPNTLDLDFIAFFVVCLVLGGSSDTFLGLKFPGAFLFLAALGLFVTGRLVFGFSF